MTDERKGAVTVKWLQGEAHIDWEAEYRATWKRLFGVEYPHMKAEDVVTRG